jgi:hypothetical protein
MRRTAEEEAAIFAFRAVVAPYAVEVQEPRTVVFKIYRIKVFLFM